MSIEGGRWECNKHNFETDDIHKWDAHCYKYKSEHTLDVTQSCPNCGTEISKNQKFCRSCGMGLQMISEAVAEHLSTADFADSPDESEASKRRRMSIRTLEPLLRDKSHMVV